MVKCQNEMVFFSYLQLILSHPLINKISVPEEGYPHHFLLQIIPLKLHPSIFILLYTTSCPRCIPLHLPLSQDLHPPLHYVPLLLPPIHLHSIRPIKLYPSLCILFSPSYCPHSLPLRIPLSHDMINTLHCVHLLLPILHLHVFHTYDL